MGAHPAMAMALEIAALRELCPSNWQRAQVPGLKSRDDIIAALAKDWVSGPNSVDNECLFVLGEAPDPCTVAVIGNGPLREPIQKFVVTLGRRASSMINLVMAAVEMLEAYRRSDVGLEAAQLDAALHEFAAGEPQGGA